MRFRYTMEPRYNEPLYNEVLGIANYSDYPSNSNTYMTKNLDITKPCYCKTNFASPLARYMKVFFQMYYYYLGNQKSLLYPLDFIK